jgi:uracil permease
MIQKVDLGDNRNLFVVSVILIAGVGGFTLNIVLGNSGTITITEVACALILGIIVNFVTHLGKNKEEPQPEAEQVEEQPKEGE